MSVAPIAWPLSVFVATASVGTGGPILVDGLDYSVAVLVLVVAGYGLLHATSGRVVDAAFRYAGIEVTDEQKDTGTAIGKIENVLVLTLILLEAYTALGVIFAAKSLVRADDMDTGNTSYYLTGTLANFTYSVVVGVVLHLLIAFVITYDVLAGVPILHLPLP